MPHKDKAKRAAYDRAYREAHRENDAARYRAYREAHREELNAKNRAYNETRREDNLAHCRAYSETHQEERRAYNRAYRESHRDELNTKDLVYREAHRERRAINNRAYLEAHREELAPKRLAVHHNRKARKRGNGGRHTAAEWRARCDWFGNVCLRCKATTKLSRDHVVPLAKGGTNAIDNLQPLCAQCNSSKNTKTVDYRDPELLSAFLAWRKK